MNAAKFRKSLVLLALCIVACLVVGSFADLNIAQALYNPSNLFGRFGAAYGQLPAEITIAVCGLIFVHCAKAGESGLLPAKALMVIGWVLFVGAIACDIIRAGLVFDTSIVIRMATSALIVGLPGWGIFMLARETDPKTLFRYALFCIFVILAELLVVNLALKEIWQRPRPRVLFTNEGIDFQAWWQIGCPDRKIFIAEGVAADGFRSFPSGHTANAACALLLASLPLVAPVLEKFQTPLFLAGVLVAVLVAASRMVVGAHFLSDVSVGFAVTTLSALIGTRLFF